jgi:hypothetical protein
MRKATKKELEEKCRKLEIDNSILQQAVQDLGPRGAVWWTKKKGDYFFGTSRLTGANGGLFFTVFCPAGQHADVTVELLDDAVTWKRDSFGAPRSPESLQRVLAIEHAELLRNREFNTKETKR